MRYLISDIHGDLILFKKMLREINFNFEYDELIIVGDILDRNEHGIKLYQFIKSFVEDGTMKLLIGNHELFAIKYMEGELSEKKWISFGGEHTLKDLKEMSDEEKEELLLFLKGLPLYLEIETEKYGKSVITHTGLSIDTYVYNEDDSINVIQSIEKAAKENLMEYLISLDIHYAPVHIKQSLDRFLFVGHVCTFGLNDDASNKIYRTPYYMNLDCGAGHKELGGALGCYCIDTDEEFYVQ
ncbi:MAG: metallophosphoesterase [Lachnospiraceae bacterium]|nr:metallophosphoesterase [Lachnospiraceae bacterium]